MQRPARGPGPRPAVPRSRRAHRAPRWHRTRGPAPRARSAGPRARRGRPWPAARRRRRRPAPARQGRRAPSMRRRRAVIGVRRRWERSATPWRSRSSSTSIRPTSRLRAAPSSWTSAGPGPRPVPSRRVAELSAPGPRGPGSAPRTNGRAGRPAAAPRRAGPGRGRPGSPGLVDPGGQTARPARRPASPVSAPGRRCCPPSDTGTRIWAPPSTSSTRARPVSRASRTRSSSPGSRADPGRPGRARWCWVSVARVDPVEVDRDGALVLPGHHGLGGLHLECGAGEPVLQRVVPAQHRHRHQHRQQHHGDGGRDGHDQAASHGPPGPDVGRSGVRRPRARCAGSAAPTRTRRACGAARTGARPRSCRTRPTPGATPRLSRSFLVTTSPGRSAR